MKIAIESNDGKTINSPFNKTTGYIVCDVDETNISNTEFITLSGFKSVSVPTILSEELAKTRKKFSLSDCETVITRGMDRERLSNLKKKGVGVFVTFNVRVKDALRAYLKERLIHKPILHA